MGSHPVNLGIRFLLEVAALIAVGMWGWKQSDGWLRFVLAAGLPILMGALWVTFAVPDDPSRNGSAPVVTPGLVRLLIELAFFAVATWSLHQMGMSKASMALGLLVVLHYAVSYDRIAWLLAQ